MAEPALIDPAPFDFPLPFPDTDLSFPSDALPADDLAFPDFDFDFDFDVGDFLQSPAHPELDSHDGSGVSSSSSPGPVPGCDGPPSPDYANSSSFSPDSVRCSGSSDASGQDVKREEGEKGSWGLKRKNERDGGGDDDDGSAKDVSNINSKPRSGKLRRSDEGNSVSSCAFTAGCEDDEKRVARLMRNRESAQLSRQRKKIYVDELEDKVKSMNSTINELKARISFVMAENASLRMQLGANGPPPVGPPPGAMGAVHLPWIPGYALRPQGSQVPLVPIPRLKPQQPAPAPKAKKAERKKGDSRTKKVASISLLGLLFVVLVFGTVVPGTNHLYGGSREAFEDGLGINNGEILGKTHGRVLTVSGGGNSLNGTDKVGLCDGKMRLEEGGLGRNADRNHQSGTNARQKGSESVLKQNASETLPALLYVPRNGKHVKINGNLIIHSVLASERAIAHLSKDQAHQSKDSKDTSLAISPYLAPSDEVDRRHSKSFKSSAEHQMALAPGFADGPLPQWFREGMAGPMLSSGMCTEVFQFDVSPISAHPGGIAPASSAVNSTLNSTKMHPLPPRTRKTKNRRIMHSEPIPLPPGATLNETERLKEASESKGNRPASSVVVSVLADPREAGDGDGHGRISSPKSLSRVFVVVLLDSVKYVTYSCVLPFKNSEPHLVN